MKTEQELKQLIEHHDECVCILITQYRKGVISMDEYTNKLTELQNQLIKYIQE